MTNSRPRDAFFLMSFAIENARGKTKLVAEDFKESESQYSHNRLDALFAEWEHPYDGIQFLKHAILGDDISYSMDYAELKKSVIDMILLFLEDMKPQTKCSEWLENFGFYNPRKKVEENTDGIIRFLFDIGILGVKSSSADKIVYSFTDDRIPDQKLSTSKFYFNPVYRKALGVSAYNPGSRAG